MTIPAENNQIIRFATFEVDLRGGEVRKGGVRLKLTGQPFQVLAILLEQPGQIVTREELQKRLWPETFVDVDHNLNTAINKIREALSDSAENPRFVETLPRRGYRFLAPVEGLATPVPGTRSDGEPRDRSRSPIQMSRHWVGFVLVVFLVGAAVISYKLWRTPTPSPQRTLARLTFDDGLHIGATWSPDGRYIAYASNRGGKFDIWVQQVSGGDPVQITKGPGHNWQPDWSTDGKYIAYRSEDGEGGLFIMPALGGAGMDRKISALGYYPRWSPDGSKILFQTGHLGLPSKVFVVNVAESDGPREVLSDVTASIDVMSAVWHPDGKRISIWGWVVAPSPIPSFWTGPIDSGGRAIKTEVSPEILSVAETAAGRGISGWADTDFKLCWATSGKAIYFERTFRDAKNIWRMTVDPGTLRAIAVERLTTGTELEVEPSLSPDGKKLAFTSEAEHVRAWIFPFDAVSGRLTGGGQAASSQGIRAWEGSLSSDGKKLAFSGNRAGKWELWEKSLFDGDELPIAAGDSYLRNEPQWSPDGIQVAYMRLKVSTGEFQAVTRDSKSRNEVPVTEWSDKFMFIDGWSPDGKWLLASVWDPQSGRVEIWKFRATGVHGKEDAIKVVSSDHGGDLWQGQFSPDGQWIVFEEVKSVPANYRSTIYVVSATGGSWIEVTDGKHWDDKPRWSPDGKSIYFLSERDGFFNVFRVRYDSIHGKPAGEVSKITDFKDASLMVAKNIPTAGLSLTQDRLMITVSQSSGSIWVLDNVDR